MGCLHNLPKRSEILQHLETVELLSPFHLSVLLNVKNILLILNFRYSSTTKTINKTYQVPLMQMEFTEDHWLWYGWMLVKVFRPKSAFLF